MEESNKNQTYMTLHNTHIHKQAHMPLKPQTLRYNLNFLHYCMKTTKPTWTGHDTKTWQILKNRLGKQYNFAMGVSVYSPIFSIFSIKICFNLVVFHPNVEPTHNSPHYASRSLKVSLKVFKYYII